MILFAGSIKFIPFTNRCIKSEYASFTQVWVSRGGSRAAATSEMEHFVIIVNGFQPLTIVTKHSILDVAAALDPPLGQLVLKNNLS